MIITLENFTKSYGEKRLFAGVNLSMDAGDKVGIVGVNGTGKSTFLKAIAGLVPVDDGTMVTMRGLRIEYLAQDKVFDPEHTVLMEVFRGMTPLMDALRGYELALAEAAKDPESPAIQKRIMQYAEKIDELDGWQVECLFTDDAADACSSAADRCAVCAAGDIRRRETDDAACASTSRGNRSGVLAVGDIHLLTGDSIVGSTHDTTSVVFCCVDVRSARAVDDGAIGLDAANDTADTSPTFKVLEEGANTLGKESAAQLANRQLLFINKLKAALVRIENKTYGICRETGKLIPKERLRVVPHATLSIDAKNMGKR